MSPKENTEQKIIEAAQEVFHKKGFEGARMQEIADTARINKGLLHYYFKSKSKLFEMVFGVAFEQMFSKITSIVNSDDSLETKITQFCQTYIGILSKNSYLPRFVINELSRDPDKFIKKMLGKKGKPDPTKFFEQIREEGRKGSIREVDPKHLMINMVSMCIFPFLARPMVQVIIDLDNKAYKRFVEERKKEVPEFMIHSLRP